MRAYIDTSVIIDLLGKREPYFKYAKKIFELICDYKMVGYISSSAFTDIYYIGKKFYHDEKITRKKMVELLQFLEILDTMAVNVKVSFDTPMADYEDGLIEEISYNNMLDCIITRNKKDYKNSRVKVYTPSEFLTNVKKEKERI